MKKQIIASILLALAMQSPANATHYIDLSHDYSDKTPAWPTAKHFKEIKISKETPQGAYVAGGDIEMNEHDGTHLDAPNHFSKGHKSVEQIDLSDLIGPAVNIDVRDIVKADPDHQINIQDIKHWETVNGKIPPDSIVLLNTGYGSYWDNYRRYTGMTPTAKDSAENFHFPGLDPQAAEWLISQRKVKAIGIDTFSIDYGQTQNYATHQILTKNDIPIFENISSMTKLPPRHFKIYAFPMKIKGGTGAPLRIVAEVYQ